jgi:hypothetical protein
MECKTLFRFDKDGNKIYKDKKKFISLDDAIKECKIQNASDFQIHKLVSYKCKVCGFYHIGRNGNTIKEKDKLKYIKEINKKKIN